MNNKNGIPNYSGTISMHEQCSPEGSQHSLKNTSWSKCNLELFNVALLVTQVVALIYLTASVNQTSMQHKSFVSLKRVVKKIEKGLRKMETRRTFAWLLQCSDSVRGD